MIATGRGLAVLAAIAAALVALRLGLGTRDHAPVDRALAPGFDAAEVAELHFMAGQWGYSIKRVGDVWRFTDSSALVDPAALDAVLTALRGARWHRRADASAAGITAHDSHHAIRFGGTTLAIGDELPGTAQRWIVRDGVAYLVDSWVATALDPDPLALHVRHPLACGPGQPITARTAEGPLRVEAGQLASTQVWLDERALARLADACAGVEIVALGPGTRGGGPGLHVAAAGELTEAGTCPDGRSFVETSSGAGCVEAAALRELRAALHALTLADAIDRRPLPIDPDQLVLADGTVLHLGSAPRIGDEAADPDRVRELVAALTTRGTTVVERPGGAPRATVTARDRAGTEVTLELWDHVIARAGEPAAIRVEPAAWQTITRPSRALRDPTRWHEDPITISALTVDGVRYQRGAVLGEWTRAPAGPLDPALVDALAEALASVRAPAGPPPRAIAHHVALTITPPVGPPQTHALALAAPTGVGCAARVDQTPVVLPLPLCTAVIAVASSR